MKKINGLTEFYNCKEPLLIENADFFYVSKDRKIIPFYNIFMYYFFNYCANLCYIGLADGYEIILKDCCINFCRINKMLKDNEDGFDDIIQIINTFCHK